MNTDHDDDPLAAARGIALGSTLGFIFWGLIGIAVYIFVAVMS